MGPFSRLGARVQMEVALFETCSASSFFGGKSWPVRGLARSRDPNKGRVGVRRLQESAVVGIYASGRTWGGSTCPPEGAPAVA